MSGSRQAHVWWLSFPVASAPLAVDFKQTIDQALSDLQRLAQRFESLSMLGGKETADLQNDLSEFVFYRRAGLLKDQAVQEFIKARSPDAEAQRQAKLKGVDIDAVVMQATPPALFDRCSVQIK